MIFTIIMFIIGFILGICVFHVVQTNGEEHEFRNRVKQLQNELNEMWFNEADSNSHIICPTCGRLMNLDKKMIIVENGEVAELIYVCPYCSTHKCI